MNLEWKEKERRKKAIKSIKNGERRKEKSLERREKERNIDEQDSHKMTLTLKSPTPDTPTLRTT